jgi:hypothetical protein
LFLEGAQDFRDCKKKLVALKGLGFSRAGNQFPHRGFSREGNVYGEKDFSALLFSLPKNRSFPKKIP